MPTPFVVIRGGGVAGQVLRKELELRGIPSHLEERATFPRDKVCGGVLQADSWEYLNSTFKLQLPIRKIQTLSQFWGPQKISSMKLSQEMVYVPRLDLDKELNSQNLSSLAHSQEETLSVMATGAEDATGEWIGFHAQSEPVEEMRLHYTRDIFLGITPTLNQASHVAFIVRKKTFRNLEHLKHKVLHETGVHLKMPLKGTTRILYGYSAQSLAVGDAMLTTHPFLGLGMKHAILSARLLARMISENRQMEYDRVHRRIFKKFHQTSERMFGLMASPIRFLGLPLLRSKLFFQKIYEELHSEVNINELQTQS